MRVTATFAVLSVALTVLAAPYSDSLALRKRQSDESSGDLLSKFECAPIVLLWARGQNETGVLGNVGQLLCATLRKQAGGNILVDCQGLREDFAYKGAEEFATYENNAADIGDAMSLFTLANVSCPYSFITYGGWSQGSALMAAAVNELPEPIKDRIGAGIYYGSPKNKKYISKSAELPSGKLMSFCRVDDGVCDGDGRLTSGHSLAAYTKDGSIEKGADFILSNWKFGPKSL